MGGPFTGREQLPVNLARRWTDQPNSYGEHIGFEVFGVQSATDLLETRPHQWKITHHPGRASRSVHPVPVNGDYPVNGDRPVNGDIPRTASPLTGFYPATPENSTHLEFCQ